MSLENKLIKLKALLKKALAKLQEIIRQKQKAFGRKNSC